MTGSENNKTAQVSANHHADTMREYIRQAEARVHQLGNRGPIRFDANGRLQRDIIEAYWRCGCYVFEGVVEAEELNELRTDVERVLARAPVSKDTRVDASGEPAIGSEFTRPSFSWAVPLSDPVGGTGLSEGRHPIKMIEPARPAGAAEHVIQLILGNLQLMDSCLRLYAHPGLLAMAEAVNGPDFSPFNEVVFVKEPGLGPSVAWHQDGTTHWQSPMLDQGSHGFNFMVQLYGSTPGNGVWVLPGTHKLGKVDIKALVEDCGSERIPDAVPLVCGPGDAFICNRQLVHGSFANTSPDRRVTVNFGFLPRKSVLNVTTTKLDGKIDTYSEERIHERSRMIAVAIDARRQRFPDETPYVYQPLVGEEDANRWSEDTRETIVKDYNLRDMHL